MTVGHLKILRIEIDGHFRGSRDVPRPWVAQIDGPDSRYGLARTFVECLRDWRDARRANSGNLYGLVAAFPLHEGKLYEVSRLRGRPSKRHVAREFIRVVDGKMIEIKPTEALAIADGYQGVTVEHAVPDGTQVSLVTGIGTPAPLGFVMQGASRLYLLREGHIHEVCVDSARTLVMVREGEIVPVTDKEAMAWLMR